MILIRIFLRHNIDTSVGAQPVHPLYIDPLSGTHCAGPIKNSKAAGEVFLGYMVYLLQNLQKPWVTTPQINGYGSRIQGEQHPFISTPYLYVG